MALQGIVGHTRELNWIGCDAYHTKCDSQASCVNLTTCVPSIDSLACSCTPCIAVQLCVICYPVPPMVVVLILRSNCGSFKPHEVPMFLYILWHTGCSDRHLYSVHAIICWHPVIHTHYVHTHATKHGTLMLACMNAWYSVAWRVYNAIFTDTVVGGQLSSDVMSGCRDLQQVVSTIVTEGL